MENEQEEDELENFNILVVDDEEEVLKAIVMTIQRAKQFNCQITTGRDGEEGLAELAKKDFDLVLSDFRMPKMNGIEFLSKVKDKYPNTVRIIITGFSEVNVATESITKAKVHNYIEKPWNRNELTSLIYDEIMNNSEKLKDEPKSVEVRKINNTELDKVDDALKKIMETQDTIMKTPIISSTEEIIIFEFNSADEFNAFSREIKSLQNARIEDMEIFEKKYIVKVNLFLDPTQRIL